MAPTTNHRLFLAERPGRGSVTDKTFKLESTPIPALKDGEVLVQTEYLSIDPAMRMWLVDVPSYIPPVQIGETMRAGGVGRVVASKADGFKTGDLVAGTLGWQDYCVTKGKLLEKKETPANGRDVDFLGFLGVSGMTAYFGMFDVGRLKDGDVVCVSGAAGSVGLIAMQIALAHKKCKVIAIAGTPDKVEHLRKLGAHVVLNYKDKDFAKQLKKAGRIDLYFDNVGGEILDLVIGQIKPYARIALCGAISQYNTDKPYGLKNTAQLISMKARMEGFIAFDYESRYGEARAYLADLANRGQLKYDYYIKDGGLKGCVPAFQDMFAGRNTGKTIVSFVEGNKAKL